MTSQKQKARTYARNRRFSRKGNEKIYELDSFFLLKLTVVILLGTLWLKFNQPVSIYQIVLTGIPLGAIVGVFLVRKLEKYQFNRKIWYFTLFLMTIISYFLPAGIVV